MTANTGSLTVAGHAMKDKPSAVRALTAVARIGSVTGPEPGLDSRRIGRANSACWSMSGRQVGRARFAEACDALRLPSTRRSWSDRLAGEPATLFAVALACVRVSAVILLDDLDLDVSAAAQQRIVDGLLRLARTGPTIVVSTTDRIPVMEADVVLDLTPSDGAAMWQLTPIGAPPGTMMRQLDPGRYPSEPGPAQIGSGPLPPPPGAAPPDEPPPGSGCSLPRAARRRRPRAARHRTDRRRPDQTSDPHRRYPRETNPSPVNGVRPSLVTGRSRGGAGAVARRLDAAPARRLAVAAGRAVLVRTAAGRLEAPSAGRAQR